MKREKHELHLGYGFRVGLLGLLAAVMLLVGASCTRNGDDPSDTRADSMFESSAGTVADNNVGSVTDKVTDKVTEKVTENATVVPGTMAPATTAVPETERVTSSGTARGGK